ncbi:MAG: PDZ domain-containing protein, partial [Rhodospirillaceae bacterium]|nr:PDZ domain-containing protein [Rhodospirillaceae bacterium]
AALGDQSPDGVPVRPSIASLGLTVAPVDSQVRRQYGLSQDAKGLVILDVEHNSAAAAKGLRRGDLITHVNGDMVTTAVDMKSGIDQARQNKRDTVLLRILRRNQPVFVAVKIA